MYTRFEREKGGYGGLLCSSGHLRCHVPSNPTPWPQAVLLKAEHVMLRTQEGSLLHPELASLDPLRHTLPQRLLGSRAHTSWKRRTSHSTRGDTWRGEGERGPEVNFSPISSSARLPQVSAVPTTHLGISHVTERSAALVPKRGQPGSDSLRVLSPTCSSHICPPSLLLPWVCTHLYSISTEVFASVSIF